MADTLFAAPPAIRGPPKFVCQTSLVQLEADYTRLLKDAVANDAISASYYVTELRVQEFEIDVERQKHGLPLRFHTEAQLEEILNDNEDSDDGRRTPALYREFLSTSVCVPGCLARMRLERVSPPPLAVATPYKKVTVGGCETFTLDGLIKRLQELRLIQGGDAPVWRDITDGSSRVLVTQPIRDAETDGAALRGVVLI